MKGEFVDHHHQENKNSGNMFTKIHHSHHPYHHPPPPPPPNLTFHQPLTVAAAADETNDRSPASPSGGDRKEAIAPQPVSALPAAAAGGGGNDGASIEVIRRPRGRPPGSKNKPKPPVIITRDSEPSMSPYILEVPAGVDLVDSVTRFCRKHNTGLCVLNGSGTVSNVTFRQPSTAPCPTVTFHGRFDILSISATIVPPNASFMYNGTASAFTISLAGPQGAVVGGAVVGPLLSAGTVHLISATFNNPSYYRFPTEDETRNSGGGGSEGRHPSPQTAVSGGGEGSAAAPEPLYSGHLPSDVIWAPTARQPPPY
ncbi:PREDICTED: AT-hook motif nuclear-localized protein 17-like [Ipomoea nil]|uniref:AT-hook motif nuclear-localized protein 17-like n=1 Tax=Ipomoea nil TaxID=35883 RepID=UPI0009009F8E|nr:PREDICTED: AT-hook motif nuclear-localized protein 17-like [Ipomoea nil]